MNPLRDIMGVMRRRGYRIYNEPYRLNIVGVRSSNTRPGRFDDVLCVFFRDERGRWQFHRWPATTDPGTYWLRSPMHPQGTAILAPGQYVDAYRIDRHRGKYYALCQRRGPVTVIRDYDRDAVLDFRNGVRHSGMFGINIHRARAVGTTKEVDRHSAGCQVFADAEDFARFMELCEVHKRLHGDYFTYTLIDLRAMRRAGRRRILLRIGVIAGLFGLGAFAMRRLDSG